MYNWSLKLFIIFIAPLISCSQNINTTVDNTPHSILEEKLLELQKKTSIDAQYQLALHYLQQEEYENALEIAKKLSKRDQLSTEVGLGSLLIQVAAYTQLEKDKKIENIYTEAFKKYPFHYLLYQNYGVRQLEKGNLEVAEQNIQKSISLKPNKAELHLILSQIQAEKGNRIKAILPLYSFLIFSENESQQQIALNQLKTLIYSGIEVVQENGLSFTLPYSKDTEDPELQALEIMINEIQTDTSSLLSNDLMKFHVYTYTIFKFMHEYQYSKLDFWWETYGKLLGEIYKRNFIKPFVYTQFKEIAPQEYKKYMLENAYDVRIYQEWLKELKIQ